MKHWLATALLVLVIRPASAQHLTPSFDCAKAHSQAEKLICSDEGLAALDRDLSDAYQTALRAGTVTKASQRAWIKSRDAKCATGDAKECLRTEMEQRFSHLPAGDADVSEELTPEGYEKSCLETAGKKQAAIYVRQCISISPATHPPCNVGNPCDLIIDEITRSCQFAWDVMYHPPGGPPPTFDGGEAFCKSYLPNPH